ncbi:MAG TPA: LuxR C-terminal-related transcriptional regulator [Pseudolysinimonas sp.]
MPRIPANMLPRTALLDRVGRSPLTVIRGPGGAGKTVLMSSWTGARDEVGAWVAVEPDIGDRLGFWSAVGDAVAHVGVDLQLPLHDSARSERDAIRPALVRGFREMRARFVLVIDDAHELRDPVVLDDLLDVLRACPPLIAVVGTRARSGLEAPREALTLDVTVIGPDDLSLTPAEVEAIVGTRASPSGTPAELLEASGGNPLLLRAILSGSSAEHGAHDSAARIVRDLLAGVFARDGNTPLEGFATTTSIPDDVGISLAAHLSGLDADRVPPLLASLESDGLLMRCDTADGPRFRYHPLVREVLRADLKSADPDRYRRLSLMASANAEAEGRYLPALRHAVDAEDYSRASDVCLHGGMSLLRSPGAAAILQQVPRRYVARLPFIAIVLGLAANARGERWKGLELLTLALGASRASRNRQRVAERVGLALVESVVLRITGRASESMAAARRMVTLLDQAPAGELDEIANQVDSFRLQAALSLFRGGGLSEARIAAEKAGVSSHALEHCRPETLGAASVVAAVQAIRGEARAAGDTLARIDASPYPPELRDGYVGSLAHLARGIVALETGDAETAEHEVDVLRELVNLEHLMLFAVLRSFVWLWRGRAQIGLRVLEERAGVDRPRARLSRQDRQALAAARVLLHASLGRMGAAHDAARTLDREDPIRAVLEAELLLLEQRPDLVLDRLSGSVDGAAPRLRAASDVLSACAAVMAGDAEVAETAMRRFLAAGAVDGLTSPFILIPAGHRHELLELAARIGADDRTISELAAMPAPFDLTGSRVVLTPRESEVLGALRRDVSQARIAADLGVSANTVKSQTRTLYRKLGASTREEALRAAYLQGLLEATPEWGG